MLSRRSHRYIGLVMLLPLILWTLTGALFLIMKLKDIQKLDTS